MKNGRENLRKYRNKPTTGYASRKEANRAKELELLQKAGQISDLDSQVRFEIIPKQGGERAAHYIADWTYIEDGELVVEDCKGVRTRDYVLKRKLMLWVHNRGVRPAHSRVGERE